MSMKPWFNHSDKVINKYKAPELVKNDLQTKYDTVNSAFIHVRRGDFLDHPYFDVGLYNSYFSNCLDRFPKDTKFLVCSDDFEWCKKYEPISSRNVRYVDEENEVNTLWIMSLCGKGGICSNSSFSWWGAYLNQGPGPFYYPNLMNNNTTVWQYRNYIPRKFTVINVNTGEVDISPYNDIQKLELENHIYVLEQEIKKLRVLVSNLK